MKKNVNPEALAIQRRFFEALDMLTASRRCNLSSFCAAHGLNRIKYSRIKNDLNVPPEEMLYKTIDMDALSHLCRDFGISPRWLLLGTGAMFVSPKAKSLCTAPAT